MKLHQIEVFLAVVEAGTISAAARELGAAQSAVSNVVHALEADLSTTLFTRTSRRALLTEAGSVFLPEARRVVATVLDARAAVLEAQYGVSGPLTLGVDASAAGVDVSRLLATFAERHARVRPAVQLSPQGPRGLLQSVADRELDAAFLSWPFQPPPQVHLLPLKHRPFSLLLPQKHPRCSQHPVSLEHFGGEQWIDLPTTTGSRRQTDALFARMGHERIVGVEVPDVASAIEYVNLGLGISLVPDVLALPEGVHEQLFHGPTLRWSLSLATAKPTTERPHRKTLGAFIDHVRGEYPAANVPNRGLAASDDDLLLDSL